MELMKLRVRVLVCYPFFDNSVNSTHQVLTWSRLRTHHESANMITTNREIVKRTYGFSELLTKNAKLKKGRASYNVRGLALAPAKMSGRNVCPESGFCGSICVLWFAGRTVTRSVRAAMKARTDLFFEDRERFLALLQLAIRHHVSRCRNAGELPVVRLNTASDLPWERIAPQLFTDNPDVTFYDYTKITSRALAYSRGQLPDNYHVTYSVSERSNDNVVRDILERGSNVAVVVDSAWNPQQGIVGKIPKTFAIGGKRFQTVDGDEHDIRIPELDGSGNVVMLRGKGGIVNVIDGVAAGFIRKVNSGRATTHAIESVA